MEHQLPAMAVGGSENEIDMRVLDQARRACTFHGNTEIRAAPGEGVRSGKERDNEGPGMLAEAKTAPIGKGRVDAPEDGKDDQQVARLRSCSESFSHHMPIPRMYIGWVKIQTATAYIAVLLTAHSTDIDQTRRLEFTICRITLRPAYQETNKPRFTIQT